MAQSTGLWAQGSNPDATARELGSLDLSFFICKTGLVTVHLSHMLRRKGVNRGGAFRWPLRTAAGINVTVIKNPHPQALPGLRLDTPTRSGMTSAQVLGPAREWPTDQRKAGFQGPKRSGDSVTSGATVLGCSPAPPRVLSRSRKIRVLLNLYAVGDK